MGEAKRKKSATVRFLDLAGWKGQSSTHLAESVWVLKGAANFAAALTDVGWRSSPLSAVLNEMISEGVADRSGVEWIRWPSGREQVRKLPVEGVEIDAAIQSRLGVFQRRGNGVALLVFRNGQLEGQENTLHQSLAEAGRARAPIEACSQGQVVCVESVKDLRNEAAWQIKVKVGSGMPADCLAMMVIDELERMASTKELLIQHSGRVMLTFSGLEKDEREAWDVPEVMEVVRRVSAEVKWWPLMTHLTHAYLWLACCLDRGETKYLADGQVYHAFDLESLGSLVQRSGMEAAAVMAEVGLSDQQARAVSDRVLGPLARFVGAYSELHEKVARGDAELRHEKPKAIEPLLWRAKFEGVSADDMATKALERRRSVLDLVKAVGATAIDHFGIVIDRSVGGQEALNYLRIAGPWWRKRIESDAVTSWEKSTVPYLVIWGSRTEAVVLAMPCDSMEGVLKTALPFCVNRGAGLSGKGQWAVCVSPTQEQEVLSSLMAMGALEN